uniref:Uncharacterized protein n=1 Tax=Arundo donax TaxID=35708 RepID=A0A0A9DDK5_ARUDO
MRYSGRGRGRRAPRGGREM